jgi:serine/threonine-protein kinase RsbW
MLLDVRIPNGTAAASVARRHIASLSDLIPGHLLDDVTLMVSELVTNSFRHGNLAESDPIQLRVRRAGDRLRVEVADPGGGTPSVRTPDPTGGWGLHIVRELASDWGCTVEGRVTLTWFELHVDEPST